MAPKTLSRMNVRLHRSETALPARLLKWSCIAFVFWIGSLILTPFPHYLPPDFDFGFLGNKSEYFYRSGYFLGFYAHIAGAPLALFTGGAQMSRTVRVQWPRTHRRLGQLYVASVLLFAAPGGLIMSTKAYGGWSSTVCFALLAIVTWASTWNGWRAAKSFDFRRHQVWMIRSYVLMLSAVFLRLTHFAMQPLSLDPELTYQVAVWVSWLVPLALVESVWFVSGHLSSPDKGSRLRYDSTRNRPESLRRNE